MPVPYGVSKGRLFLLKVTDGITPTAYQTVGGMKATSVSIGNEMVDVMTKDEAPWRQLLATAGERTVSITASGIFKDTVAENLVRSFAINGGLSQFQLTFEDGDTITGSFLVSKFEYTGASNGAQEYSITLEASGTVVVTPHA